MTSDPTPPASDDADQDDRTTPGGQVGELDDMADDVGADIPADD